MGSEMCIRDSATAEERQEIIDRLSRPRQKRNEEDIARILLLITNYGSLDYAQDCANHLAKTGLSTLDDAFRNPANPIAFNQLRSLFRSLVTRDS